MIQAELKRLKEAKAKFLKEERVVGFLCILVKDAYHNIDEVALRLRTEIQDEIKGFPTVELFLASPAPITKKKLEEAKHFRLALLNRMIAEREVLG